MADEDSPSKDSSSPYTSSYVFSSGSGHDPDCCDCSGSDCCDGSLVVDVEITGEDSNVDVDEVSDDLSADGSSSVEAHSSSEVSGITGGDSSRENIVSGETSTSTQLPKTRKEKHSRYFSLITSRLFDDKVSPKQKLKWMKKLAKVKGDGTIQVHVPEDASATSNNFGAGVDYDVGLIEEQLDSTDIGYLPPLQIVMLIVGTRGDVQPFVAVGKCLQEYGHRVRLATHSNFEDFVLSAGLEFYPLGGDPKVLAGHMVKNKGFLPSDPSEISVQRHQLKSIIESLLPACKEPDPKSEVPFCPDAIIANPPAYGHTHVAEALKVHLHIFFTMPWTPTFEFPHPLSRVKQPVANRLSYHIVDGLIWLGIRGMINHFRKKQLKLRPVTYLSESYHTPDDVPYGYIWSPHLVAKPKDWGPNVDVVGFCFLDLASNYEPPEKLAKWLSEKEEKPIYIGFGSLPVREPEKMTQIIVEALEKTGQRGIINTGWGGLGNLAEPKDFVYLLDNCPHDWLFSQCAAVVHHGGAGTTSAGLKAACPTTIVPFFGDQPFWGERVHAKGVGPRPIPIDEFSLNKLVDAINFMLDPKVKQNAIDLAKAMEDEDGVKGAVRAFYKHVPRHKHVAQPQHAKLRGSSQWSLLLRWLTRRK